MAGKLLGHWARLLALGVALVAAHGAHASTYNLITQDYPYPTGSYYYTDTWLYGINDSGTMVGNYDSYTTGGNYTYSPMSGTLGTGTTGNFAAITGAPSALTSSVTAFGINNAGTVVGTGYNPSLSVNQAWVLTSGTSPVALAFDVNIAGTDYNTYATGINNKGEIVGYFYGTSGYQGFTASFNGTAVSNITPVANTGAAAGGSVYFFGVNDSGNIAAAIYPSAGNELGAIYSGGAFDPVTNATLTGENYFAVTGINNANTLVGYQGAGGCTNEQGYVLSGGSFSGGDFTGGTLTTLADSNVPADSCGYTDAWGINNLGQIVGTYGVSSDPDGFYATPASSVPEPASLALLGAGVAGLLIRRGSRPAGQGRDRRRSR